jgi:hypothetical protein
MEPIKLTVEQCLRLIDEIYDLKNVEPLSDEEVAAIEAEYQASLTDA